MTVTLTPAALPALINAQLPLRVLLIEDSSHDVPLIEHALKLGGYMPQSVRVDTLPDLSAALERQPWDVILADYTLPGFTALAALAVVQAYGQDVPFLVVSGTLDAAAAVAVMRAGAHDYMGKDDLARLVPAVTRELHEVKERRARREAEALVRTGEERFQAQYQGSPIPILIWQAIDGDFVLNDVNRAALDFTQGRLQALLGHKASVVYHEHPQTLADVSRCYAEQTVIHRELWWALQATDERRFLAVSYAPVPPNIVMLHFVDLTARKRAEEALDQENHRLARASTDQLLARRHSEEMAANLQLVNEQLVLSGVREQEHTIVARHLAMHDSLTGLPNRMLLLNRLEQSLSDDHRHPVSDAVLMLDMDRFKTVNDTFGHQAGDHFLQEVARRLCSCVRPQDTVARLGGDEFALLLSAIKGVSEVIHIADRIHESLNKSFAIAGQSVESRASIGIVLTTAGYTQAEELLHDADTALYRAKALGKARSVIFDMTMHDHALALTKLEAELRHAIIHEEFLLHYQPIVSLHNGAIIGVEALLRWQHPTRGCILPGEFLGALEEAGLIISVGNWVLRTACAQMHMWHTTGLPPLYVAVNLSARQLQQRDLPEMVARVIQQTGFAPQYLHLELTESSVMADVTTSITTLQQLTALGVRISVDDFGTGYSSLSYLKHLPVTTVKVDRSFVEKVASDPDDAAITSAIIAMAHRLKLEVIAEGVETEAQLAYLCAEECDTMQGYLFSAAVPASALENLLRGAGLQLPDLQPVAGTG